MSNVIDIASKQEPVCYSLHITHHYNGELEFSVSGIGENPSTKAKKSIVYAMKNAIEWIEAEIAVEEKEDELHRGDQQADGSDSLRGPTGFTD